MQPRPDHGESSYVGSGRLAGRKALITGGDSGIGRAAAIAYAREGADVAFGYLPVEEEDAREVVAADPRRGPQGRAAAGRHPQRGVLQEARRRRRRRPRRARHPRQQRRLPAGAGVAARHHDRAVRLDLQDQRLRDVLDHQGGAAAPAARRDDHQHGVDQRLRSVGGPGRLRRDQGRDRELQQVDGQAAGAQGHPRQRGRARPVLDAAAAERRPEARQAAEVRRRFADGPAGPAGRDRAALCPARARRGQLRQRRRLRQHRRQAGQRSSRSSPLAPLT